MCIFIFLEKTPLKDSVNDTASKYEHQKNVIPRQEIFKALKQNVNKRGKQTKIDLLRESGDSKESASREDVERGILEWLIDSVDYAPGKQESKVTPKPPKEDLPKTFKSTNHTSQSHLARSSVNAPIVKMIFPNTLKTESGQKYTQKDLIADRERLEQKIESLKNMLNLNDTDSSGLPGSEDGVRVRRKTDSDRTANKIAKMFLTLSAVNGLRDRRKSKCTRDDDYEEDVWEEERRGSPSRKSSSSNEERYKVKKWVEYMKNKRSSRTCPCTVNTYDDENDLFPLERKLSKGFHPMQPEGSSEELSDGYKTSSYSRNDRYSHGRPTKNEYYENRPSKNEEDAGSKLFAFTKRGRRKLELPLDDLELYRSRAKQILQNAEEILDKIKEEEEKRKSAPSYVMNQLRELTSKIQGDPRNTENDLIRMIQKTLGWGPLAKGTDENNEGNSFPHNVKSYILEPYEKAKALTEESTRQLSKYILQNLGKIEDSSGESPTGVLGKETPKENLDEDDGVDEQMSSREQVSENRSKALPTGHLGKDDNKPESKIDKSKQPGADPTRLKDALLSTIQPSSEVQKVESDRDDEALRIKEHEEKLKKKMQEVLKDQEEKIKKLTEKSNQKEENDADLFKITIKPEDAVAAKHPSVINEKKDDPTESDPKESDSMKLDKEDKVESVGSVIPKSNSELDEGLEDLKQGEKVAAEHLTNSENKPTINEDAKEADEEKAIEKIFDQILRSGSAEEVLQEKQSGIEDKDSKSGTSKTDNSNSSENEEISQRERDENDVIASEHLLRSKEGQKHLENDDRLPETGVEEMKSSETPNKEEKLEETVAAEHTPTSEESRNVKQEEQKEENEDEVLKIDEDKDIVAAGHSKEPPNNESVEKEKNESEEEPSKKDLVAAKHSPTQQQEPMEGQDIPKMKETTGNININSEEDVSKPEDSKEVEIGRSENDVLASKLLKNKGAEQQEGSPSKEVYYEGREELEKPKGYNHKISSDEDGIMKEHVGKPKGGVSGEDSDESGSKEKINDKIKDKDTDAEKGGALESLVNEENKNAKGQDDTDRQSENSSRVKDMPDSFTQMADPTEVDQKDKQKQNLNSEDMIETDKVPTEKENVKSDLPGHFSKNGFSKGDIVQSPKRIDDDPTSVKSTNSEERSDLELQSQEESTPGLSKADSVLRSEKPKEQLEPKEQEEKEAKSLLDSELVQKQSSSKENEAIQESLEEKSRNTSDETPLSTKPKEGYDDDNVFDEREDENLLKAAKMDEVNASDETLLPTKPNEGYDEDNLQDEREDESLLKAAKMDEGNAAEETLLPTKPNEGYDEDNLQDEREDESLLKAAKIDEGQTGIYSAKPEEELEETKGEAGDDKTLLRAVNSIEENSQELDHSKGENKNEDYRTDPMLKTENPFDDTFAKGLDKDVDEFNGEDGVLKGADLIEELMKAVEEELEEEEKNETPMVVANPIDQLNKEKSGEELKEENVNKDDTDETPLRAANPLEDLAKDVEGKNKAQDDTDETPIAAANPFGKPTNEDLVEDPVKEDMNENDTDKTNLSAINPFGKSTNEELDEGPEKEDKNENDTDETHLAAVNPFEKSTNEELEDPGEDKNEDDENKSLLKSENPVEELAAQESGSEEVIKGKDVNEELLKAANPKEELDEDLKENNEEEDAAEPSLKAANPIEKVNLEMLDENMEKENKSSDDIDETPVGSSKLFDELNNQKIQDLEKESKGEEGKILLKAANIADKLKELIAKESSDEDLVEEPFSPIEEIADGHLQHLDPKQTKTSKLKVPKSIGKIMQDLEEGKNTDDLTSIQDLDPKKIDHFIDKIDEVKQQGEEVDCKKECACADEIDLRARKLGRYEIVKDFLHWMKDLKLNRVLSDD